MMPAQLPTPEPATAELMPEATCQEVRLWRAVLARILLDAQAWRDQRFTQAISRPVALDAWQAISENTADFRRVCEMAGVDPDSLRVAFLRTHRSGKSV